jgi:hypothetical protein
VGGDSGHVPAVGFEPIGIAARRHLHIRLKQYPGAAEAEAVASIKGASAPPRAFISSPALSPAARLYYPRGGRVGGIPTLGILPRDITGRLRDPNAKEAIKATARYRCFLIWRRWRLAPY